MGQIDVEFKVNERKFEDAFLIPPSMNSVLIGNPFFRKYDIEISPGDNLLKLPEVTYELNEIKSPNEGRKTIPKRRYQIAMNQKNTIRPQHQEILHTKIDCPKNLEGHE